METATAKTLPVSGFKPSWSGEIVTATPEPVRGLEQPASEAVQVRTGDSLRHNLPQEYKVAALSFSDAHLRLRPRKPVTISVARGQDLWFAENLRLDIFATGDTAQDAIHEFMKHVLSFYRHYKELTSEEAMGNALSLKTVFEESFVEACE
ncbi:MAG: hypothetical protein RDU20_11940 [Desulfomonilaceae bacterium]|nr:hypothetical protein [Desulfomonilaceae bacterium]